MLTCVLNYTKSRVAKIENRNKRIIWQDQQFRGTYATNLKLGLFHPKDIFSIFNTLTLHYYITKCYHGKDFVT